MITRDEYKKRYTLATFKDYAESLIDSIYDDFKSRTCENCKYYVSVNESSGMCINIDLTYIDAVDCDFSCNKWESK